MKCFTLEQLREAKKRLDAAPNRGTIEEYSEAILREYRDLAAWQGRAAQRHEERGMTNG